MKRAHWEVWDVVLLISASLGVFLGCGPRSEPREDARAALVVGMELSYPPFEMTDESGRPTGVSVDLARALGEFLEIGD